jgi:hypothetical protein
MATTQLSNPLEVIRKGTNGQGTYIDTPDQAQPENYNNIAIDGRGGVGNPDQRKPDETSKNKAMEFFEKTSPAGHIGSVIGLWGTGYYVHSKLGKGWGWTILAALAGGGVGHTIGNMIQKPE